MYRNFGMSHFIFGYVLKTKVKSLHKLSRRRSVGKASVLSQVVRPEHA